MALAVGDKLGPYEITAPIGSGGMGEVWRARDPRLNREVAIKVSAERFGERFAREARAIAALDHPNVCQVYDVGPNYLVMELVAGETLASRIKKGPLGMEQTLRYGAQIADALAAAHSKGIVHRDLKPANIMINKAGAKVLDFGLAKSQQDETVTVTNAVMGTPAYMAPEQRAGRESDARTDIYALGLVLTEMTTGNRQNTAHLQGHFAHIVERCLAANPEDRWQAASDVKAELHYAAKTADAGETGRARPKALSPWAITGVACLALVAAGWLLRSRSAALQPLPLRFSFTIDGQLADGAPEPSPDGGYLVANPLDSSGHRLLWIRSLDEAEGRWIPETEGAGAPFWSGDGRWIGFYASGRIKKVSPAGGSPQSVVEVPGVFAATWNARGDIIFAPNNRSGLYLVKENGGPPQPISKLDAGRTENSHRWPQFLPDGRHFLFTARCTDAKNNAIYLASLGSPEVRRLMYTESQAVPVPGALLFVREGTLFRQNFTGESLTGEPVALSEKVLHNTISAQASFSASSNGAVVLARPASSGGNTLTWTKRDGSVVGTLGSPGMFFEPRFSPDGGRLVFDRPDGDRGNRDLWAIDIRTGVATRLTTNPANDLEPAWSADGKQILFASDRAGGPGMEFYRKDAENADGEQKIDFKLPPGQFDVMDWSRDGRWVAFHGHVPPDNDIIIAPITADRVPFPFFRSRFAEFFPRFSPDGKWIAYTSDEPGRREIFVRAFAGAAGDANPAIQVSNRGGGYHAWSRDGSELFYLASDFKMYSVRTRDLKPGSIPASTALFTACPSTQPFYEPLGGYPYDVAPDGRFLIACRSGQSSFVVTVNGSPASTHTAH